MSTGDPHERVSRAETRLARAQNIVAAAFEIYPNDRTATVAAMIAKSRRQPASYWLQLILSMGIATFGLVLASTAVVIGAMLISPLMGPIVEFGMGLAIGSPFLALRSFVRVAGSILVVVCSAAAITILLPFHETTTEIAARTSPTVLDLLVAVCCAVAAAYAVVRPGSDTTATAAGTAIGIALVPPLCVVGYGLGTRSAPIARGATLLFTANFCAILLFAVLSFVLLGYGQVSVSELEEDAFRHRAEPGASLRVARFLGRVFSSTYGQLVRFVMPIVLLVAVYIPLRRALEEVSWEVSVRSKIQVLLRTLPTQSVQASSTVERHEVDLRLVMVGKESEAAEIQARLIAQIQSVAGVVPTVQVLAVPDAHDLRLQMHKALATPAPAPPRHADPAYVRGQIEESLRRIWPVNQAGRLLSTALTWQPDVTTPQLDVVHLGAPLGAAGEQLLAASLSGELASAVTVHGRALPWPPSTAEPADAGAWLSAAARTITDLRGVPHAVVCIESPPPQKGTSTRETQQILVVLQSFLSDASTSARIAVGQRWSLRVTTGTCATDAQDGGADDGGDSG